MATVSFIFIFWTSKNKISQSLYRLVRKTTMHAEDLKTSYVLIYKNMLELHFT